MCSLPRHRRARDDPFAASVAQAMAIDSFPTVCPAHPMLWQRRVVAEPEAEEGHVVGGVGAAGQDPEQMTHTRTIPGASGIGWADTRRESQDFEVAESALTAASTRVGRLLRGYCVGAAAAAATRGPTFPAVDTMQKEQWECRPRGRRWDVGVSRLKISPCRGRRTFPPSADLCLNASRYPLRSRRVGGSTPPQDMVAASIAMDFFPVLARVVRYSSSYAKPRANCAYIHLTFVPTPAPVEDGAPAFECVSLPSSRSCSPRYTPNLVRIVLTISQRTLHQLLRRTAHLHSMVSRFPGVSACDSAEDIENVFQSVTLNITIF
ncbi:hypothetical protein GGX14DRAFT_392081 [Mycena pura]|uniref:Uncharacterized protein n=1 Tax=Mycena pura TaxID=153505 RepID=A0AAD6VJH5_9AGAR|nr:hypothetical protein GGX14DRAFT_392081 [Mycena pura]